MTDERTAEKAIVELRELVDGVDRQQRESDAGATEVAQAFAKGARFVVALLNQDEWVGTVHDVSVTVEGSIVTVDNNRGKPVQVAVASRAASPVKGDTA